MSMLQTYSELFSYLTCRGYATTCGGSLKLIAVKNEKTRKNVKITEQPPRQLTEEYLNYANTLCKRMMLS